MRDERQACWESFQALQQEIRRRGWCRPATARVLLELTGHVTLSLGGMAVFLATDDTVLRVLSAFVSALGSIGVGTNTHTSSHNATSGRRGLDEFLTYFGYPLFLGLSATHWRYTHIVRHHPAPNVLERDLDHDLMPWFSMVTTQFRRCSRLRRLYYQRLQWLVFPFALAVNGFHLQFAGWRHLLQVLLTAKHRRRENWLDAAVLIGHWLVWLAAPMVWLGAFDVVSLYLLRTAFLGYLMFGVLAPAHFPAEALCLDTGHQENDFVLRQTATTLNFRAGAIWGFFCSGLQFQIEHHLFPNLSHAYYARVNLLVREFCRAHGYPHRTLGWWEAILECWKVFRFPKEARFGFEFPFSSRTGREADLGDA